MNNLDFSGSFVGYQSRTWKDDLLTHIRGLGEIDELRPQRFATLTHLWLHRCGFSRVGVIGLWMLMFSIEMCLFYYYVIM